MKALLILAATLVALPAAAQTQYTHFYGQKPPPTLGNSQYRPPAPYRTPQPSGLWAPPAPQRAQPNLDAGKPFRPYKPYEPYSAYKKQN